MQNTFKIEALLMEETPFHLEDTDLAFFNDREIKLDSLTLEEKLLLAHEEEWTPFEIKRLALSTLQELPSFASAEEEEQAFEVLYGAFSKVLNK